MLCPTQCSHFHISLLPTCMCYVTRGIQTHFSPFPYSTFVLYLEYTSLSTFTFLEEIFQLYPHSKLNYFESSNKYHNIIHNTASIEHVLCSETVVVVLYMLFLILMKTDKVGIIIVRDKQGGAQGTFVKCLRSHTWQLLRSEPRSVCSREHFFFFHFTRLPCALVFHIVILFSHVSVSY